VTDTGPYVSTKRLERALRTCAKLVALPRGERFIPFFERIEAELEKRKRMADTKARALALLRKPAPDDASTPTLD